MRRMSQFVELYRSSYDTSDRVRPADPARTAAIAILFNLSNNFRSSNAIRFATVERWGTAMDNTTDTRQSPTADTPKPAESKRWHAPKYETIDLSETASDFIAVTDTTSFFS